MKIGKERKRIGKIAFQVQIEKRERSIEGEKGLPRN